VATTWQDELRAKQLKKREFVDPRGSSEVKSAPETKEDLVSVKPSNEAFRKPKPSHSKSVLSETDLHQSPVREVSEPPETVATVEEAEKAEETVYAEQSTEVVEETIEQVSQEVVEHPNEEPTEATEQTNEYTEVVVKQANEEPVYTELPAEAVEESNEYVAEVAVEQPNEESSEQVAEGEPATEAAQEEAATAVLVVALADFPSGGDEQLELVEGQAYYRIVEDYGNGWSFGSTIDGSRQGIFPQTFVQQTE
jgi:hypothetical protein